MKLKKYIIGAVTITLVAGALFISKINNSSNTVFSKEEIFASYENLINDDGIEYIKVSLDDGSYIETYRDTLNGKDQMDHFDESGNLITRSITNNFGQSTVSISNIGTLEEPNYIGTNTLVSKSAYAENKSILSESIIKSTLSENSLDLKSLDLKNVESNNKDLLKYTSNNYSIYVDESSGRLAKCEILADDKILTTIEIKKIDRDSQIAKELFNIDSPFSSKIANDSIDIDAIEFKTEDLSSDEYPNSAINSKG